MLLSRAKYQQFGNILRYPSILSPSIDFLRSRHVNGGDRDWAKSDNTRARLSAKYQDTHLDLTE